MKINKTVKIFVFSLLTLVVILILYIKSFEEIELVCDKTESKEIFLLNYIKIENIKSEIYNHNKNIKFKGNQFTRIYLKNFILKIADPIFNDEINYRKDGCELIDNMDIYCEVRFRKLESGKVDVWYNFLE